MRTSILSRSVIAIASLAIGSVALAAAPANAASASGVTRDMVLTAANGVRASESANTDYSLSTVRALTRIISRACNIELAPGNNVTDAEIETVVAGHADGILVSAYLHETADDAPDDPTYRQCTFVALTTTDAAFTLSGNASITVTTATETETETETADTVNAPITRLSTLSNDVFVTAPINATGSTYVTGGSFSATGNATRTFEVPSTTKVSVPKSAKQKKAAKQAYAKKVKAAKKAYAKALKKAGNKNKKAAAKKAFSRKKVAAKAAYAKAIATTSKLVPTTLKQTENRPFTVSAALGSGLSSRR